jgi:nitrate reductase delta subunit
MYSILSKLLSYPKEKIDLLGDEFSEFRLWYDAEELYDIQEHYVDTFDLSKNTSLNLFDYIYGEDPNRGAAMADLIGLYADAGFILIDEMPDYLPALLEFAAESPKEAAQILPDFVDALNTLNEMLNAQHSPYAILIKTASKLMEQ